MLVCHADVHGLSSGSEEIFARPTLSSFENLSVIYRWLCVCSRHPRPRHRVSLLRGRVCVKKNINIRNIFIRLSCGYYSNKLKDIGIFSLSLSNKKWEILYFLCVLPFVSFSFRYNEMFLT